MSNWEKVARYCQEVYGSYIDWEERFFIEGECQEPIYEEDYNSYEDWTKMRNEFSFIYQLSEKFTYI